MTSVVATTNDGSNAVNCCYTVLAEKVADVSLASYRCNVDLTNHDGSYHLNLVLFVALIEEIA